MDFRKFLENLIEKKEKVLVAGMGISGIETAAFLRRVSIPVVCVERQEKGAYFSKSKHAHRIVGLEKDGAEVHFGTDGEAVVPLLRGVSLAVVSPGISHSSPIFNALKGRGIPLVSELELGIELYRVLHGADSIVVTGSNGKTTTVSFLHHAFSLAGVEPILCGNVGTPVVSGLLSLSPGGKKRILIVEASSYQLESCTVLKPRVGIFLNLSENHLERHGSMAGYLAAKARLFANQTRDDAAVLNRDDPPAMSLAPNLGGRVLLFGDAERGAREQASCLFEYRPPEGPDRLLLANGPSFDLSGTRLAGRHNRYNLAAAVLALREMGLHERLIAEAINGFEPLEHRLERLASPNLPVIINDSKSTTVAASVAAVKSVRERHPERRLTLLIGGLAKAGSWDPLMNCLREENAALRPVVCFGKDGPMLADQCRNRGLECRVVPTLESAATSALEDSAEDEIILLSPGCASFDEFSDFEARGRFFKEVVGRFYAGGSKPQRVAS